MLCDIGIKLDLLVIATDALTFDIMEMGYLAICGIDHVGEDFGCLLHTCLVIIAQKQAIIDFPERGLDQVDCWFHCATSVF